MNLESPGLFYTNCCDSLPSYLPKKCFETLNLNIIISVLQSLVAVLWVNSMLYLYCEMAPRAALVCHYTITTHRLHTVYGTVHEYYTQIAHSTRYSELVQHTEPFTSTAHSRESYYIVFIAA